MTVNGDFPAGRPFGAIMEADGYLYISTHSGNHVHQQLRANGNIQILAKKETSRDWLRVTGLAEECKSPEMKVRMWEECPVLQMRFSSPDANNFLLFRVTVLDAEFK